MKKIRIISGILAIVCLVSGCVSVKSRSERLQYEEKVDEILEDRGLQGGIIVAGKDGIIYDNEFYETENSDEEIGNNGTKQYEVGGLTRLFTVAAICKLESEGLLSLDDKLSKYFPTAVWGGEYSVRDLVNMNTRIPDYTKSVDFSQITSKDAVVNQILSYDLAKEMTGDSNSNYYLLGVIIERVSGMTYSDYIKNKVIYPSGYKNIVVGESDYQDLAITGIQSDIYDMYHWNNEFFDGNLLSESYLSDLKEQAYTGMCGMRCEYGVYYLQEQNEEYSTYMKYDINTGVYVLILLKEFNPAIVSYGDEVYKETVKYVKYSK